MLPLVKRDFLLSRATIVSLTIIFVSAYLVSFFIDTSQYTLFIYLYLIPIFSLFTLDYRGKINCYVISLPIKRSTIVKARYLFSFCYTVFLILLLWIVDLVVGSIPNIQMESIIMSNRIVLFSVLIALLAILLLIHYLILYLLITAFVSFVTLFTLMVCGIIATAMGWLDWFYALSNHLYFSTIVLILATLLFYLSMKASEKLFSQREIY
ncbi:ABC-2 transporter permease [Aquibacillus rhizosphaerae]|uniref:ABC-2 transporter permease n=1 Tax=Aquibacillus rhizosphaerae TaxID=3051431 RepID=A0ABT7L5G5_9BACI|nr:ABC-2 transporter permease [Aquibacillus sp. LR5S19]MDL4841094.1 ABC-2 transporter permease [Aquibacillus sp. LR5S19]